MPKDMPKYLAGRGFSSIFVHDLGTVTDRQAGDQACLLQRLHISGEQRSEHILAVTRHEIRLHRSTFQSWTKSTHAREGASLDPPVHSPARSGLVTVALAVDEWGAKREKRFFFGNRRRRVARGVAGGRAGAVVVVS